MGGQFWAMVTLMSGRSLLVQLRKCTVTWEFGRWNSYAKVELSVQLSE